MTKNEKILREKKEALLGLRIWIGTVGLFMVTAWIWWSSVPPWDESHSTVTLITAVVFALGCGFFMASEGELRRRKTEVKQFTVYVNMENDIRRVQEEQEKGKIKPYGRF